MGWEAPRRGDYLAVLSTIAEPGRSLWLKEGRDSMKASSVFLAAADRAGYSVAAGVRMMERFDPTLEEWIVTTEIPSRAVLRLPRDRRTGGGSGG